MTPLSTRAWSRWIALAAAALAAAPASAGAATAVDQGPIAGTVACSSLDALDTTCVLPFGDAATSNVVVTEIALGEPDPAVFVARPIDGKPGSWSLTPSSQDPTRWRQRQGTYGEGTFIDVRIPLQTGERLVLVDPRVTQTGTTRDFTPTDPGLTEADDGEIFAITPVGRVVLEADADADGFGDDTQDLCRGVQGQWCAPASGKVALTGPAYVPSQQPASWTWSITNTGSDPQPFMVNLYSAEANPVVTGPPGAVCAPGQVRSALESWGVKPSALVGPWPPGTTSYPPYNSWTAKTDGFFHCVLPPLAGGATASGTIGGSGGHFAATPLRITAVVPLVKGGSYGQPFPDWNASGAYDHRQLGTIDRDWIAYEILQGKISAKGRWPVSAKCGGPLKAPSCAVSAVAKAPVGGKVLGKAVPVSAAPGTEVKLTVVFTKSGKKWLASHRRSSIDLQVTTVAPGETPAVTTDRSKPSLSSGLKRAFAKSKSAKAKK